jgi:iron(III) transport system ATP-binding protein
LLNAGRIEQQGSAVELYTEPATLFCAEFMGNNNRLEGTLLENADKRAVMEVKGLRLEGVSRTQARIGEKVTGVIRLEKLRLGGGPGPNRMLMGIKAQMYMGERWELLFTKDELAVRTYVAAPLKHEHYHVEFPSPALWIF